MDLTNKFMRLVESESPKIWTCKFGDVEMKPRRIRRNDKWHFLGAEEANMTALEIMKEAIHDGAWRTGEPGCVFLDTVNDCNTLPGLGRIRTPNPCVSFFFLYLLLWFMFRF